MIKYKEYWVDFEMGIDGTFNFIIANTSDKTGYVWKVNALKKSLEQALELVEQSNNRDEKSNL